jgi:serine/threonine protein kinase
MYILAEFPQIISKILVDDSGNLRLTDFGLSMVVSEAGNLTFGSLQAGSTRWMAPEFTGSAEDIEEPNSPLKPTTAGDIYSFGCIMLQVCWIMTIPDSLVFSPSAKSPFQEKCPIRGLRLRCKLFVHHTWTKSLP